MFEHPGEKLKGLSKAIFFIVLILAIAAAIIVRGLTKSVGFSILSLVVGILLAWVSTISLYAFGSIASDIEAIRAAVAGDPVQESGTASEREMPDPESIDLEAVKRAAQERKENKE